MQMKTIPVAFLLFAHALSFAGEARDVPETLFGITLGGIYDVGDPESGDPGNVPAKKLGGAARFRGNGIRFYFQPKEEYKAFDYVEEPTTAERPNFATSFRLYLLPVIPSTITSIEEYESTRLNWEVVDIEWASDAKTENDAYYWAINLCKAFEVDIPVEPEITDRYESNWYACTFSSGDREFTVSSLSGRTVRLSLSENVLEEKVASIEGVIKKLVANQLRPY